jgi:hypothetical protein
MRPLQEIEDDIRSIQTAVRLLGFVRSSSVMPPICVTTQYLTIASPSRSA